MSDKMPKLQAGYVVKIRDYDMFFSKTAKDHFAMVTYDKYGELCISGEEIWWGVNCIDENGRYDDSIVLEVYGRTYPQSAWKMTTEDRELLWQIDPMLLKAFDVEFSKSEEKTKAKDEEDPDFKKLWDEQVAKLMEDGMPREKAEKVVALCALAALNVAMETEIL